MNDPTPPLAGGREVEGGSMSMYDELVALQKLIDSIPRERWAHLRKDDDGHWQIIENGEAPPGWKELSRLESIFRIDFHNAMEVGDRFIVLEQAWEVQPDKTLERVELT